MPGGNSTARPNTRDEKKAVNLKEDVRRLKKKIHDRVMKDDISYEGARRLRDELNESQRVRDAYRTMRDRDNKELDRKFRKTQGMKSGGKVKGYKGGGCVMAGRGGSYKGMK